MKLIAITLLGCLSFTAFAQDSNQRIKEIRRLAKTDSAAVPSIEQFLSDNDPDVRAEAVRALIKVGGSRSLAPLVRAAGDSDPDVQIQATNGIVNFYLPGYVDKNMLTRPFTRGLRSIKNMLSVPNRQEIAPGIVVSPDAKNAIAQLVAKGASQDARANAARAAGILHDDTAVPQLEAVLKERDTELLIESIYALEKIKDPSAGPAVGYLVRDPDPKVQLAALEATGTLHSLTSAPDVKFTFERTKDTKVKRAALQCLAMLAMPGDRATFKQYSSDSDSAIRAAAIEGLGRIREPEDTPTIKAAFDEQNADWRVHLAAAFALVDEGSVEISEFSPLQYLLENLDQSGDRGDIAQAYLTELCKRADVRKGVYTAVPQMTSNEKIQIANIIASSHAPDAAEALNKLAADPDRDVAVAASKAVTIAQSSPRP